jgi:hypothetical protein
MTMMSAPRPVSKFSPRNSLKWLVVFIIVLFLSK